MGYAYLTVTNTAGAIILGYAEITWSGSSGSTTVYVDIQGVQFAGDSWRIKKGSTVYLQGSGIGEKSFTGTIGQSYQLQFLEHETGEWGWSGGTFTLTADSSSGGDDDDDEGGDSGGSGGSGSTYYLWIKDVSHVKTKVYRYSDGEYPLVSEGSFFESSDDDGLWYGLQISNPSYFRFDFEVDSGYTLTNQGIYALSWDSNDQDWAFRGGEDPYVWPEVSKNSSTPSTPSLPNVSTTQSVYAFIDNGSVWIPVGADAASLGLAKVSQTEIAYALVDSGSSWLPINY